MTKWLKRNQNHKLQTPNYKQTLNSNDQNSKRFEFVISDLSFGLTQDGELAEPFVVCNL
jgi:hypothetical protein